MGKVRSKARVSRKPTQIKRAPFIQSCFTYLIFHIMFLLCYIKEKLLTSNLPKEKYRNKYTPLYSPADRLFSHHIYQRIKDCVSRPVCSLACHNVTVMEREVNKNGERLKLTGNYDECINLASFNYLGLSQNTGVSIDETEKSIKYAGIVSSSSSRELGRTLLHEEVEQLTAEFLGTEAAISFGMGFATNSLNLPSIITKGCLVISDKKNHASMILGLKLCQATIRVFQHNDMKSLEAQLVDGIINGQPDSGAPWKKIFIVTEGIFSMEGSIANLLEIIALKRKYKAYLYIDEAHSIGVLGQDGKGMSQYVGCDTKEIDVLMGTYSKSFAAFGGFIAGSKRLINFLRGNSQGSYYSSPLPLAVIPKIVTTLKMCKGLYGENEIKNRITKLRRNTIYFREKLKQMGIVVCGDPDSPIVPIIFYFASKLILTSRVLFQTYKIAAAFVGYPAVDVFGSRLRICLSAEHTKEQIDYTLNAIEEISEKLKLNYDK